MATENVGGIQYTVDADTAAMIKAEVSIQKILNNMVKSFEKIDKTLTNTASQFQSKMGASTSAVKSTESTVSKSTKSIADDFTFTGKAVEASSVKFSQGMNKTSSSVTATQKAVKTETDKMVNEINDVGEAVNRVGNTRGAGVGGGLTQVSKGIKRAGDEAKKSNVNMSNFSYQLQDIAVQAQMGTNAFIIMSQQIPQMLVGMGSLATGIGAGVAVFGLLATTMINTKSNADLLQKSIDNLKAVMTVGSGGIVEYTEQMQELGRISEIVAKQRIAIAMRDANDVVKRSVDEMASKLSEVDDTILAAQLGFFTKSGTITRQYAVQIGNLLGEQGNYLDRTGDKADEVGRKFVKLFQDLRQAKSPKAVTDIQEQLIALTTASDKADKKFIKMFESLMVGGEDAEDFFTILRNATSVLEAGTKSTTDFSNATNKTKDTTSQLVLELIQQKIALEQGERAALAFKLQMDGLSEAEKEQVLALYDSNKATEEKTEATKEYEKSLKSVNDQLDAFFENESKQSARKDAQQTATLTRQVQTIGLTPEEEIKAQYDREFELLQQAEEKKIEIQGTYAERFTQIEAEKNQRLKALREQEAKNSESFLATYGDALNSINGLFGSYVNSMDKDTKKSFEKWKKYATAQALVSTLLAVGNALASPAPWPVPLIMAGVAGAAGAMNVAQIRNQSFDGAREFGGPVTAGKSYLVGERGPEMFTPNTSGGITSNKDMNGAGGGGMTVNISNNTPYEVFVTRDEAANIANVQIGREAGKLSQGRGQMASAMKRGAGTQFNGAN